MPTERHWSYMLVGGVVLFLVVSFLSFGIGLSDSHAQGSENTEFTEKKTQSNLEEIYLGEAEMSSSELKTEEKEVADTSVEIELPLVFHEWGEFEPGAWRFTRTVIEGRRLGRLASKTLIESSEVLSEKQKVGNKTLFSTVTEADVLLAGKNIQKEPRTITTDFWGLSPEETRKFRELAPQTLIIEGMPIRCRVLQISSVAQNIRREIRLWVNENTAPYVFRKERDTFQKSSTESCEKTVWNVTSLNLQLCVQGKVLKGYQYSQVSHFPTYISVSEVVASLSVPGRVVTQITHEKDLHGRALQDISTELLDYGLNNIGHQQGIYRTSTHSERLIVGLESVGENDDEKSIEKTEEMNTEEDEGDREGKEENVSVRNESLKVGVGEEEKRTDSVVEKPMTVEFSAQETRPEEEEAMLNLSEISLLPPLPENMKEGIWAENFRPMEKRIFMQFQSHWKIGKDLQSDEIEPEIGMFFPNLRFERWNEFVIERGTEMKSPKGISPLYNEKLRMNRQVRERELPFGKRIRVITTQSLRKAYDDADFEDENGHGNENEKTQETQGDTMNGNGKTEIEEYEENLRQDDFSWRRGVRALIQRRTENQ